MNKQSLRRRMGLNSQPATNAFCATGRGGGVDPSCSPSKTFEIHHRGLIHHVYVNPDHGTLARVAASKFGAKGMIHGKDAYVWEDHIWADQTLTHEDVLSHLYNHDVTSDLNPEKFGVVQRRGETVVKHTSDLHGSHTSLETYGGIQNSPRTAAWAKRLGGSVTANGFVVNPFVSEAQRAYMYANMPEMAKRWEKHTPKGKKLPKKVTKNKRLLRIDPTRTQTLRRQMLTHLRKQFALLKGRILKHVGQGDAFGQLIEKPPAQTQVVIHSEPESYQCFSHNGAAGWFCVNDLNILDIKDIRQDDKESCGAAAIAAVGAYFHAGPNYLGGWKKLLGDDSNGTPPAAILRVLSSLGLEGKGKSGMSTTDLQELTASGSPVLCPVQSYGGGHWVVVIGVGKGYVFLQDPADKTRLGRVMVEEDKWNEAWHDKDKYGNEFNYYGIAVSGPTLNFEGQPRDPDGRFSVGADAMASKTVFEKLGKASTWLKQKSKHLFDSMEKRYGRKQAIAIMASGQALAWGATVAGALSGVPIWLPASSLWGAAPGALIAEAVLQAKRGIRSLTTHSVEPHPASIKLILELRKLVDEARTLFPEITDNSWSDAAREASALARKKTDQIKAIGSKFSDLADRTPVLGVLKQKAAAVMKGIHSKLESRYGSKAATSIMASGSLGGYGVMAAAQMTLGFPGIPFVNDLVSIAVHTAAAEVALQAGRAIRSLTAHSTEDLAALEKDSEIMQLVVDWRKIQEPVSNTWTDEAREAALEARERKSSKSEVTKELEKDYEEYRKLGYSRADCNSGECGMIAGRVVKSLQAKGVRATFAMPKDEDDPDLGHIWIYHAGKHYDVEMPEGVSDPSQLPAMKGVSDKLKASGWKMSLRNPLGNMNPWELVSNLGTNEYSNGWTVAVDFDGRITPFSEGAPFDSLSPREGCRAALEAMQQVGIKIIVWSARKDWRGIPEFMAKWKLPYDEVNPDVDTRKIEAGFYADDKGEGDPDASWPEILQLVFKRFGISNDGPKQPRDSRKQLYALAELGQDELHSLLQHFGPVYDKEELSVGGVEQLLVKQGIICLIAPIKSEDRSREKVSKEYGGDWSSLVDIVRASIACDTMDQIRSVLAQLPDPVRVKDRFAQPLLNGYRDVLVNLRLPCGLIAEVQLHLKPLLIAREKQHVAYQIIRTIKSQMMQEGRRKMSTAERLAAKKAKDFGKELLAKAWNECKAADPTLNTYAPPVTRKPAPATNANEYAFHTDPEKVRAFGQWLAQQAFNLLTSQTEHELWQRYIESGYRKGVGRAFDDYKEKHPELRDRETFLRSSFSQPESVEKVKLLVGRAFEDLKGVTQQMAHGIRRVLTDGLIRGQHPMLMARDIAAQVDGIGRVRAETIARTELTSAHAAGQLASFRQMGVKELGVLVEYSTAGDEQVCPICEDLEGVLYKIEEADGVIARHPNCRCAWVPAVGDVLRNVFCKTGKGGGVDATCKLSYTSVVENYNPNQPRDASGKWTSSGPSVLPAAASFKNWLKGLNEDELTEYNRLHSRKYLISKKMKAGTATDEEKQKHAEMGNRQKELQKLSKDRTKGEDKGEVKKESVKVKKEPEKVREESSFEKDVKEAAAAIKRQGLEGATMEQKSRFLHAIGLGHVAKAAGYDAAPKSGGALTKKGILETISKGVPGISTGTYGVEELMDKNWKSSGIVQKHGMGAGEEMRHVVVDGVKVHWSASTKNAAARFIQAAALEEKSAPNYSWQSNTDVVFSHQRSSKDSYWEQQYHMSGFKSAATGGDGKIVVYNGKTLEMRGFHHESGHNLATKTWGHTDPTLKQGFAAGDGGSYAKAMQAEPGRYQGNTKGVTAYGANSESEDFAEAHAMYNTHAPVTGHRDPEGHCAGMSEHDCLKKLYPSRFKAIEDILRKHYGN